jgi:hypothetical protein
MDSREIWYTGILWKSVGKIQIWLKLAKISGPLSEDISIFYCCRRRKIVLCEGNGIRLLVYPRRYERSANVPLLIFTVLLVWPQLICVIQTAFFKRENITCKIWNSWPDCDYYRYVREFQSYKNYFLGVNFRSKFCEKSKDRGVFHKKNAVDCTQAKGR